MDRIPLRVQEGGQRFIRGDTHTHSATQKAAQKEGDFEGADRLTPRHVGMRKLQNIT